MLDDYTRAHVNRAIEDALRPRGMSTHSGKVSIDAGTLQRLIVMIDRSAEALLDAQKRIPLRLPEPMTGDDVNKAGGAQLCDLLDHIYEYGTTAEGVMQRAVLFARAIEAEVLRRVKEANE